MKHPPEHPYRILSFDGGPSALFYVRMLREIEEECPGFLDQTTLFAGTSAGAFAALYLANQSQKRPALERLDGCIQFVDSLYRLLTPNLFEKLRFFTGLCSMKSWGSLEEMFVDTFGEDKRLSQLPHPVAVVTFRLKDRMEPVIYQNWLEDPEESHRFDPTVQEAAMQSAAFPMALPVRKGHIDGGFFANNPSLFVLSEYAHILRDTEAGEKAFHQLDNLVVFSLGGDSVEFGTERDQKSVKSTSLRWGWLPWLLQPSYPFLLMDTAFNANILSINAYCERLLGTEHYWRLSSRGGPQGFTAGTLSSFLLPSTVALNHADRVVQEWRRSTYDPNGLFQFSASLKETCDWIDARWLD